MSSQHTGLYQCAYSPGHTLSERSEPLLLVVTGVYRPPSLSAHPGPVVASGGRVSLLCSSQFTLDTVHLFKEGGAEQLQHRKSDQRSYAGTWQAVFPVGPVSSSHGGTYRCYGSSSSYPNVWSQPSAPLHLEVTGVYKEPYLSVQPGSLLLPGDSLTLQCRSEPGFDRFAPTKGEGLTLLQHLYGQHSPDFPLGPVNLTHGGRYRCYSGHNLSYVWSAPSTPLDILIADAALMDPQPGEGMELNPQNGTRDSSKEVTYTQVNCRSRLRQGMDPSPSSLSEKLLNMKGRQAEEDRQMDRQAAASEDPQDVTYAQLNLLTLRRETTASPFSPSEQPSDEPSVYAALAVH
ncbi:leukocyte immunoglobulin-like receptor subfamily B member 2 isoform X2 [Phyllostomus hastatus]|uniref:leukocyte immunoglobulin-like receptor subfamily B member 2 isoform X2 n=1 Tax=Phyllostomus hastatus TaxID=9423 RepID=UPI001E681A57|nr:leukocyte immunoglobulin-like receptor subfamily B member 2 isoform X2 [Phyllostomus hastatus]